MRERIVDLLEKVDLAVAESGGVVSEVDLAPVVAIRNDIRTRLAYPDSVLVAGLVGGTGSGKSSLLNAIASEEVSEVGGVRPTTGYPLALVPEVHEQAFAGYLDRLEVIERVTGRRLDWVCLIDLPDTDSVVVAHKHTVDALLPRLDLVIWLLDPEKYRDAAIHDEISRLSESRDQFFFVLNQVDRIGESARSQIESDLESALTEDGIDSPRIYLTAANPPAGPPVGIGGLIEGLRQIFEEPAAVYRKLAVDLDAATGALLEASLGAQSLDVERRWAESMQSIKVPLASGRTSEAAHIISALVSRFAHESGDAVRLELEELSARVGPVIDETIAGIEIRSTPAPGRFWQRRLPDDGGSLVVAPVLSALESEVGEPLRKALRPAARSRAAIADLALSVSQLIRSFNS